MSKDAPNRFVGRKKGQASRDVGGGKNFIRPRESVDEMEHWFKEFEE